MATYPGPYALLGDAFARGTAQIAANAREDRLRREQREQQLQDIADARAFQQQQIDDQRQYQDYVRDLERMTADQRLFEEREYQQYVRDVEEGTKLRQTESARKYETESRREAWDREEKIYNDRRYDTMKNQLVAELHLDPEEVKDDKAFRAALQKHGNPTDLKELADYKAMIGKILESVRPEPGLAARLSGLLKLKSNQMDEARSIMAEAYGAIERTVEAERNDKDLNAKNGSLLMLGHMGKLAELEGRKAGIDSELARINAGRFNPTEDKAITDIARTKLTPDEAARFAAGAPTDEDKAALQRAMPDAIAKFKAHQAYNLAGSADSLNEQLGRVTRQMDGVKVAIQTGAARFMNPEEERQGWAFGQRAQSAPAYLARTGPGTGGFTPAGFAKAAGTGPITRFTGIAGPAQGGGGVVPAPGQPGPEAYGGFTPAPGEDPRPGFIVPAAVPTTPIPEPPPPGKSRVGGAGGSWAPEPEVPPWWSLQGLYNNREAVLNDIPNTMIYAPAKIAGKAIADFGTGLDRLLAFPVAGKIPEQGFMGQLGSALGDEISQLIMKDYMPIEQQLPQDLAGAYGARNVKPFVPMAAPDLSGAYGAANVAPFVPMPTTDLSGAYGGFTPKVVPILEQVRGQGGAYGGFTPKVVPISEQVRGLSGAYSRP